MISFDIYDDLPCGILCLNEEVKIDYINEYFAELLCIRREDYIGVPFEELSFYRYSGEKVKDCLIECITDGKAPLVKQNLFVKNEIDKKIPIAISARRIIRNEKDYYCVSAFDLNAPETCNLTGSTAMNKESGGGYFQQIIGNSPKMQELFKLIRLAADSLTNVVIQGESGTGKELIARAIHNTSSRKDRPFIAVNCSSLSETLLESELFGHIKGAFTGAYRDKAGRFEAADGGTIFLDEIGEISQDLQVKLLRVLQDHAIERVGDSKTRKVDIRIIAATNKNLRFQVSRGEFREDFFYRLNVFPIFTIPLRERKNDIPMLTNFFIKRYNRKTGKQIKQVSESALHVLMDYCWPGNVRELENCIEHAFVLCQSEEIDVFDLPQELRVTTLRSGICAQKKSSDINPGVASGVFPMENASYSAEDSATNYGNQGSLSKYSKVPVKKKELEELLKKMDGSRTRTAEALGISTVALWRKMKKFNMI